MSSHFESQFLHIVQRDVWLMELLNKAASLRLTHWAIAAGSVRSAVWDYLHGYERKTPPSDIDFIFYDSVNSTPDYEKELKRKLTAMAPAVLWEPVNQATIHLYNKENPYASLEHAMSRWAETATAVGVYLNEKDELKYYAPHGLADLMEMIFRPHLVTPQSREVYLQRIATKGFECKWPQVKILMPES